MDWMTLESNPTLQGGAGVVALVAGLRVLQRSSGMLKRVVLKECSVSLEVTNRDKSYPWVLEWVTEQRSVWQRTQHLSVNTSITSQQGSGGAAFSLVPGPGIHWFSYSGKWIGVERSRESVLDFQTGKPWEKIHMTAFGRDPSIFQRVLQEAYSKSTTHVDDKLVLYTNWGSEWRPFGEPRRRRPLESVVLDTGIKERLLADVQEWQQSRDWYRDRGIPYRRGYLLYGSPGSGKSSFIHALAGHLGLHVCMLNLNEPGLSDDRLALALSVIPANAVVLLEDVDAAFHRRSADSTAVSFSGLLNALDGVAASEERLVFMTTNHRDQLDPALIRPGRVDCAERIGDASDAQLAGLFARFYPSEATRADEFASKARQALQGRGTSMAAVQGYFLQHKHSGSDAIQEVAGMVPQHDGHSGMCTVVHSSGRRRRTASDVDAMLFQPQEGWEEQLPPMAPHWAANK